MKALLLQRMQEPSTWRGLVMIVTSLGIAINPALIAPLIAAGTGIAGLVGVFAADK
jgi:hypothetical protein